MRDEAFKAWLSERRWNGKPLTSVSNRMSKARRFERSMRALGLPYDDLDKAFDADGMEAATTLLRLLCKRAADTGEAPAELVGTSTIPIQRMNNLASAVRNYRQFLGDEAGKTGQSSWPALDELKTGFLDRVPDFESFTKTDNTYERVERHYKDKMAAEFRQVAASDDSDEQAGRRIYRALMPNQGPLLRWQTEDDFNRKHQQLAPAFYGEIGRLARSTAPTVDAVMGAADGLRRLREQGAASLTVGEVAAITITVAGFARPGEAAPFKMSKARELASLLVGDPIFRGQILERDQLRRWLELLARIRDVMRDEWQWEPRDLIDVQGFAWAALDENWVEEDDEDMQITRAAVESAMDEYDRFGHRQFLDRYAFGEPRDYWVRRASGHIYPSKAIAGVAYGFMPEGKPRTSKTINGGYAHAESACTLLERLGYEILQNPGGLPQASNRAQTRAGSATNLILYGPPGTGKTYATAAEAIRLCGEPVSEDREELMAAYRRLSEAGRIEFVTFHQSFSYEDFVEGLRPTQTSEDGGAGFELKPEPGVFRRIARRAETSTGPGDIEFSIGGRQVFKMSIGEAANPEDAHLFEQAITGAYALLGFEDIDWSDDRYADRNAIIEAVRSEGVREDGEPNAMSGRVQMPFIFRNWVKPGDIVVVSKGNSLFRAIGEVTGGYEFAPREGGGYAHRRAMRWLWVDRAGVPASEIYARSFTQKSIYLLTGADLNVPALERYIASQQDADAGAPEPFVLIIDEINRANISKVFGELITLLEPDKRIGQSNALRVRLPYSGEVFGVPANLHIIGTMNTADRSIALLDTALRRRFEFRELMPKASLLGTVDGIDLTKLLATLNERIEYLFDREHQIGHAYFIGCKSRADVDEVMRHKVIPLLAEYFYEDWAKVAAVLGDGHDGEGDREGRFIDRRRLTPPKGIGGDEDAAPRYRWNVRDAFSYDGFRAG